MIYLTVSFTAYEMKLYYIEFINFNYLIPATQIICNSQLFGMFCVDNDDADDHDNNESVGSHQSTCSEDRGVYQALVINQPTKQAFCSCCLLVVVR